MKSYYIIALCATLAYAKPPYKYSAPAATRATPIRLTNPQQTIPRLTPRPTPPISLPPATIIGPLSITAPTSTFGANVGIPNIQALYTGRIAKRSTAEFDGGFGASSVGFAPVSQTAGGGTLVEKHIYVHLAPPEPEEVRPQRPISAGQSTKHYKIIFIKALSYDLRQQQILQAQAQNEEKTLVYVLVKKTDDVADITLPTAAPTALSKPEVYFIRYKAKSKATAHAGSTSSVSADFGGQLSGGGSNLAISGTSVV